MGEQRDRIFQQLELLYAALPTSSGINECGQCRECCTTKGLSIHSITALELEYIGHRIGTDRLEDFRLFATRSSHIDVCPYFDEERWGCGIYEARPFSCRVFGHYRSESTALPDVCVYRGQEQIFSNHSYYQSVPKAQELRNLVRMFWPHQTLSWEGQLADFQTVDSLESGDALDQALMLQSQGRSEEALTLLINSEIEDSPFSLYCVGLMLESQERFQEASLAFKEGLKEAPGCVSLQFRLGCALLSGGEDEVADLAFQSTLDLAPDHVPCLALLGGLRYTQGRMRQARELLEKASVLEPENRQVDRMLKRVGASLSALEESC